MYNEFAPKHYKGKWPCTTKTLYNEKTLTGRLHKYFLIYFETFSAPTADTLFLLVLSILTLESVHSIRFLYQHFLSGITTKSLNTFYHACSYAKVDYSHFMNITAKVALRMIPDSLATQPIFLCVDDTMVAKVGTRFENVSKLFDHAAHNDSNYLNGHCFVSIMLCIPVWKNDRVSYLSLPLGYRMWQKKAPLNQTGSDRMKYIPLFLYSFRWNIETSYYEQKTFWSLCSYMVRSCKGIEMLVNLINICYCAMKILPYQDEQFSEYRTKSVQEFRFELSQGIRSQIFLTNFVRNIETHIKSNVIIKALKQLIRQQVY